MYICTWSMFRVWNIFVRTWSLFSLKYICLVFDIYKYCVYVKSVMYNCTWFMLSLWYILVLGWVYVKSVIRWICSAQYNRFWVSVFLTNNYNTPLIILRLHAIQIFKTNYICILTFSLHFKSQVLYICKPYLLAIISALLPLYLVPS